MCSLDITTRMRPFLFYQFSYHTTLLHYSHTQTSTSQCIYVGHGCLIISVLSCLSPHLCSLTHIHFSSHSLFSLFRRGYWSPDEFHLPIMCQLFDACPGSASMVNRCSNHTKPAMCADGYTDFACAACMSDYYQDDLHCRVCEFATGES